MVGKAHRVREQVCCRPMSAAPCLLVVIGCTYDPCLLKLIGPCPLLPHVYCCPMSALRRDGCRLPLVAGLRHTNINLVMLRWSMLVCMHVPVITSALNCQCTNSVERARVKSAQREILANLGGCTCAKGKAVSSVEYTLTLKEVSASERDQVEPARAATCGERCC